MIVFKKEVTNSGLTFTIDPQSWGGGSAFLDLYTTGAVVLSADITISVSSNFTVGNTLYVGLNANNIDRNGHKLEVVLPYGGYEYREDWQFLNNSLYSATAIEEGADYSQIVRWNLDTGTGVDAGVALNDASISLSKLVDLSRGSIIAGNVSDRPIELDASGNGKILVGDGSDLNSVSVTGDISITSAGVTAIGAGVIVNADVNASAGITRSKLASGTASYVLINSGAGVMSEEARLATTRGGTAIDTSGSTGFPTISSGTWSVGSIAVDRDLDVSFEAGEVGDFKIYMGFAGTLTNIYAYATKVIAGTDNGTIVPKNNAGTTMGSGTITFTASDARGTAYTATPSTNNTFAAGDILTFTSAKTTAGGKVHLSLKFTRTV